MSDHFELPYEPQGLDIKTQQIAEEFYLSYIQAIIQCGGEIQEGRRLFRQLMELVVQQAEHPYQFPLFHQSIHAPFDYYRFGLDFIRPLLQFSHSKIWGLPQVSKMVEQLRKGENVILLANHQTEADPQVISLLLEPHYPELAEKIIFVAGHRVITDPLAIPVSMGCNLLCIYSKRHMEGGAEERAAKISHNQRTIQKMKELLNEGGYCIYVAPSGGRDRPNSEGYVDIAPFDAHSIEIFWLMAQSVSPSTHFYPLALRTYPLLPPPSQVEKELGERRIASCAPVSISFGQEIDRAHFIESPTEGNKKERRVKRAEYIRSLVQKDYQSLMRNENI